MLKVAIHQTLLGLVTGDYCYRLHVVNSVQVRVELWGRGLRGDLLRGDLMSLEMERGFTAC